MSVVPDMKHVKKGTRYYSCYKTVLHSQFVLTHDKDISYSTFCANWPQNIVKPRIEDFGTCKCVVCENSELLLAGLKRAGKVPAFTQLDLMIRNSRLGELTEESDFEKDSLVDDTEDNDMFAQISALESGVNSG